PYLLVDGHLRYTRQLVFDRILDRHDLLAARADAVDGGVQRRRLAGAGRTGGQHDAVRLRDDGSEARERVGRHTEVFQRDATALLVQQSEDDALAVQRGQRRDAHVDLAITHAQADAAVLRHPPLRDVELGHDLQAADDGGRQPARRRWRFLEHAVDAVAHAQSAEVRLEVHVAGARLERLEQQEVHQLHDRRLVGEADEVVERGVDIARRADFIAESGNDVLRGQRLGRVDAADRGAHLRLRQVHQLGGRTGEQLEVVQRLR